MSDLFHEQIPDYYIQDILAVIRQSPQHIFQILTKRAERMADFFQAQLPPANAWLGVTIENREHGLPRLAYLRGISASVRFASAEPRLEDLSRVNLAGIHWVIVGGAAPVPGL